MAGAQPDPRRNQRSDAREIPIEPGLLARVGAGIKRLFGPGGAPAPSAADPAAQPGQIDPNNQAWMGPGEPLAPVVAKPGEVAGRAYDYPVGYNIGIRPRRYEGVGFEQLKNLADSLDMVRLAIETRKDQMGNLAWSCLPRQRANERLRPPPDARCQQIEDFFRRPDGRLPFGAWMRQLVEEQLVHDAPAVYVRRNLGGEVHALEVVDGATVSVVLDTTGRMPLPPAPAYQQILKGVPAINYTADELIYWPRNLRPGRAYGQSPVEQIIMTINIALRREIAKLAFFTEGNVPEALVSVPETWTPDQIAQFQAMWDAMQADQRERRRMKFVPGRMTFQPTRSENALMDPVDEWLARVICYAFSLPPLPFVKMMNRATSETAYDSALEEGLQPMMMWMKSMIDHIIQTVFGYPDLELVWDDVRKVDPAEQEQRDIELVRMGMKSIDDYLIAHGQQPVGMGAAIFGIGPMGIMFIDDLLRLKAQGGLIPPAPVPPELQGMGGAPPGLSPMIGHNGGPPLDAGGMGAPGLLPAPGGAPLAPAAGAALMRVNPKVLNAVGLGAAGRPGRTVDVTAGDAVASDPLSNVVAHPAVLQTLRDAERRQGRSGR